ncbi:MAG TPA: zinc-ribbon domain-containing protein, partial [Anaeromyxobacteraceae bacterium]|nr:zinc-ribbon domain-containing protein [Anaeromyxobacteraceae bacterium]
MIVVCTSCQTKFRVSDEKVGPRGARVRCSRCQSVFLVHRDLGALAVDPAAGIPVGAANPPAAATPPAGAPGKVDLDLEPGSRPEAFAWNGSTPASASPGSPPAPPGADPFGLAAPPDPFTAASPHPASDANPFGAPDRGPVPDPFAAPHAAHDPFGASPGRGPDPFSAPAAAPAAPVDPFRAADVRPPPVDPFAPAPALAAAGADPFVAAVAPRAPAPGATGDRPGLQTDLADLLVGREKPLAAPPPMDAPATTAFSSAGGDALALEDRTTPPPAPAAGPAPLPAPGGAGWAGHDPFDAGPAAEPGMVGEDEFEEVPPELAPAPARAPAVARAADSGGAPRSARPAAAPSPRPGSGAAGEADAAAAGLRQGTSRLRSMSVNLAALVALLIVALAFLVVWRGGGSLDAASLRPAAILAALGRGDPGIFPTRDVTSGFYDRARGPPILFVRGFVTSRSAAPVRAVRVTVEVVRG